MENIKIINASQGNLKNISLEIPRNKLVVFTGLSGSGKSTLLVDVLFHECQRQYLEALAMEGIQKPKVERIKGASPAILISQTDGNRNPRSTVGTVCDVYTDLRMIYEKLGVRTCPYCGEIINAADCKEETEKIGEDFYVYMYCNRCGKRMSKITRTDFSFNTKEGACPTCEGLGVVHEIDREAVLDECLSLEKGAVLCWEKRYGEYQTSVFYAALKHYGLSVKADAPVNKYEKEAKAILLEGTESKKVREYFPDIKPPKTVSAGKFEGIFPILTRRLSESGGDKKTLAPYFRTGACPDCKGERLGKPGRSVTVLGVRLPQLSEYSFERLYQWIAGLEERIPVQHLVLVKSYILDIKTKITRFMNVGLGYLSLNRQTITLSGGELQRMRLAAVLDSDLSGIIYILDEPTKGLHPRDTKGLISILKGLRDKENTVLVIEHDMDVCGEADYLIDMGPGSGRAGGEIVGQGKLEDIKTQETSVTGKYLRTEHPEKTVFRKPDGDFIKIKNASKHNLKNIDVEIPAGCITAITGPSGSGKSTLIFQVLAKKNQVWGLEQFDEIVEIQQASITKMKRSNVATYSEVYTEIRNIFSKIPKAKEQGLTPKHFSFNTPGGRCENCQGLGYVESNMLFFNNIEVTCPVCGGSQFSPQVLDVKYKGYSVHEVLKLTVEEAFSLFEDQVKVQNILKLLLDVGLGYLELGQSVTTLSGGEAQRLKLAKELIGSRKGKKNLYLLDEPTTGLHPYDVEHFLVLLNRLADSGNTLIVVEHNRQLIDNCDWVIDLGPDGGDKGGQVMFTGRPDGLLNAVTK